MADIKTTLDNIQGHWSLEESSGTRVDETANNNDLTDNATVGQGTGIQGNSADFTRANSEYLSITDASQTGLDISGDWSASFWIKVATLPSEIPDGIGILGKNDPTTGNGGWRVAIGSADTLNAYSVENHSSVRDYVISDSAILVSGDKNNWVHIVVTYDISANSFVVYKNGSSVASTTTNNSTVTSIDNNSNPFVIGVRQTSGLTDYMEGEIDEVTVTSDIITSGEVTTIYNSGSGIPYEDAGGSSNIKTIAGVTQANIKSIRGVTNANIKSIRGVTNS